MSEVKMLMNEVRIEDFKDVVQVYLINNSYFSVAYKEKEEYYTKDKKLALIVGKIILTFYKNLNLGISIFSQNSSEEIKWAKFLQFLREESSKNDVDWQICLSIYQSLEATYNDMASNESKDKNVISKRSVIRNKDYLMTTLSKIASLFNEKEADKNLGRYKKLRNEYIKENPQLNLNLL